MHDNVLKSASYSYDSNPVSRTPTCLVPGHKVFKATDWDCRKRSTPPGLCATLAPTLCCKGTRPTAGLKHRVYTCLSEHGAFMVLRALVRLSGSPTVPSVGNAGSYTTCRAEAITLPEADEAMDMQLDLPLLESTLDADITVKCHLSHAVRWSITCQRNLHLACCPRLSHVEPPYTDAAWA